MRYGQGRRSSATWSRSGGSCCTFCATAAAARRCTRRGGGHQIVDLWWRPQAGAARSRPSRQDAKTEGLFTVEYPDERLPVYERFRVLPMLVYDDEDGNVRCTSCNICAKVCPPQCIWMTQAKSPKGDRRAAARGVLHRHGRLHELRALLGVLPVRRDQDGPELRAVELRAAPDAHLQPARPARLQRVLRPDPPRGLGQRRGGRRAEQGGQEEGPAAPEGPGRRAKAGPGRQAQAGQGRAGRAASPAISRSDQPLPGSVGPTGPLPAAAGRP